MNAVNFSSFLYVGNSDNKMLGKSKATQRSTFERTENTRESTEDIATFLDTGYN